MSVTRWNFENYTVIVTGGARGQGAAHARAFAEAGANVVLADVASEAFSDVAYPMSTPEDLERTAAECEAFDVRALPVQCDVRSQDSVREMVDKAVAEFGKVDVLVNNAGIATICPVEEMTETLFDEMVDTHLKGSFLCSQQVAKHMREANFGRIISIGSTQVFTGLPQLAHYTAAKHGVYGFTKVLAIELAPYKVTVNMICPTGVDTVMGNGLAAGDVGAAWIQELIDSAGSLNLLYPGELLPPEGISPGVLWLASEEAKYMTGHAMPFDCGAAAI